METDKLTKMMLRIELSSLYKSHRATYSILILLMQLVCGIVFSQESYTLKSTSTYFFYSKENYENRIKALQFDSVKTIGNDTIFFLQPNTITQTNDSGTCLQFKYNLFGSNIIKNLSGELIFLTINNDTILLKSKSPLNSEWVMYQDTLLRKILAKIIKIDTMSILPGIVDSVKYITMTFINGTNNGKLDSPLIISKNHGFINLYPFLYFPDFNPNYGMDPTISELLIFIGSENPNMGLFHMDAFDIYGYDVGDEIHTSYRSWMPPDFSFYSEDVNVVISKKIAQNNDSIIYTMKHCYLHDNKPRAIDTVQLVVTKEDKYINSFPKEFLISDEDEMKNYIEYYFYYGDSLACELYNTNVLYGTMAIFPNNLYFYKSGSNPECWSDGGSQSCLSIKRIGYFVGLGGPFYCCVSPALIEGEYNKLEYYKKGNRTGGSMLNTCDLSLSNNSEKRSQKKVSIFPNPSDGTFRLSSSVEFKNITLYNVLGGKIPVELFRETNNNDAIDNVVTIQLPSPNPGIYFLEIKGKQDKLLLGNNSMYQKLIIIK